MPETQTTPLVDASPAARAKAQSDLLKIFKEAGVGSAIEDMVEKKFNDFEEERAAPAEAPQGMVAAIDSERGAGAPVRRSHTTSAFLGARFASLANHALDVRENKRGWHEVNEGMTEYLTKQRMAPAVAKSLSVGEFVDGGLLVKEDIREQWIDLLLPQIAVMGLGPVIYPMPTGSAILPKITGDVGAYYQGEAQDAKPSKPTTGARSLKAKRLTIEVPISMQLIRRGGPMVNTFIERLARRRGGIAKDAALLAGAGTDFTPLGLYNQVFDKVPTTTSTPPTFPEVLKDLGNMLSRLETRNINPSKLGFIMAPRTKNFLAFQNVTGLGIPYFMEQMAAGNLLGWPYKATTNVPTTGGTGVNESWIMLWDFDNVVYGDTLNMTLKTSFEASYKDENGNLVSAFSRGEMIILIEDEHDIAVEYKEAGTVLSAVTWGA